MYCLPSAYVQKSNFRYVFLYCSPLGGAPCLCIHVHNFIYGLLSFHNFDAQNVVEVACFAYFVVYRVVGTVSFGMDVATVRMIVVGEIDYNVELPPYVRRIVAEVPSLG